VRTIAGTLTIHRELEARLAKFKGAEATIAFQSGFASNLGTISALVGKEDVIFSDELNHASIIDGARLSGAKIVRYAHNNANSLEDAIKEENGYRRALIISDGVFSMDGDIAPLPDLVAVAEKHDILLMIDDAHGEGVLGRGGRGIVDHFKMHGRVDIEIGTLSKAFGVVGGYVAGKKEIVEWLNQRGRPFLFSSALTAADTAACIEGVNILEASTELVDKLWDNARYFKSEMKRLGFDIGKSETPIMAGDAGRSAGRAKVFARAVRERRVRHGDWIPNRAARQSAHPRDDLRRARARGFGPRAGSVREGWQRIASDRLVSSEQ